MSEVVAPAHPHARSWRLPALWLAVLVALAVLWVAGVLVPYYANGLHELGPDALSSGAWDPAQLWPATTGPVGRAVQTAGAFVGWPLTYVFLIGSTLCSGGLLRAEWSTSSWTERALLGALVATSVLLTSVVLSPFGIALSTWALD